MIPYLKVMIQKILNLNYKEYEYVFFGVAAFFKILLYSRTKGVKQKYLLYIYLIGSVYINIDNGKCSIYTVSQLAHRR